MLSNNLNNQEDTRSSLEKRFGLDIARRDRDFREILDNLHSEPIHGGNPIDRERKVLPLLKKILYKMSFSVETTELLWNLLAKHPGGTCRLDHMAILRMRPAWSFCRIEAVLDELMSLSFVQPDESGSLKYVDVSIDGLHVELWKLIVAGGLDL